MYIRKPAGCKAIDVKQIRMAAIFISFGYDVSSKRILCVIV